MLNYYNNIIQLDLFDKYNFLQYQKSLKWYNNYILKIGIHLRFLKYESDLRIINTFLFLESFIGKKVFVKKISFLFSKNYKSKYTEILFFTIIKGNQLFQTLNYLNYYFFNYYKTYISKKILINLSNQPFLYKNLNFINLNKIVKINKMYKKKDLITFEFYNNNKLLNSQSFFSFILQR